MKVGVYHVDGKNEASELAYACAKLLVKSVHAVMPGIPVVHFTDLTSRPIKGADDVRRKPSEPMALLRMRHHAGVSGSWLFVDTDVILKRTVRPVFKERFDIALTVRNWPHLKPAAGFTERMPYNTGVVFSKHPSFWQEVYRRLRNCKSDEQHWMGDQEVIGEIADEDTCPFRIRKVWGKVYNFPPAVHPDDNHGLSKRLEKEAAIVHYKGPERKPLLLKTEMKQCA